MPALPLLLASSSPARRKLLLRLGLPFQIGSPDIDETPLPGETIFQMVQRLSEAKARALAPRHTKALIIGSDQALLFDDQILGKPGNHSKARDQLNRLSGQEVTFYTGLCLLNSATGHCQLAVEAFKVAFRELSPATIERYLQADEPYQCAGSFKAEGLGIALFKSFEGRDPNSLVGLPLMALVDFLLNEGIQVP
jgi:MAF protein